MLNENEIIKINKILIDKKIYSIKFIIPKDEDDYYTLLELNSENFCQNEYINKINENIIEFNKINPISLHNIDYKIIILINNNLEFVWTLL